MGKNELRERITLLFWILCLPFGAQLITSSFLKWLGQFPMDEYLKDFLAPQAVYPLLTGLLAFFALRFGRIPLKAAEAPRRRMGEILPWFGLFFGVVTVGNWLNNLLMSVIRSSTGAALPDVFADGDPTTAAQAVGYFVVMAILPAISEELLFRGLVVGGLGDLHPLGSVLLSSFAFAMMHATLQQIPFAFFVGFLLAFVYRKTGRILYPMLMHFFNNAYVCFITFLRVFADGTVASVAENVIDAVSVTVGVLSLAILLKRKEFSLPAPREEGRRFGKETLSSVGFWTFTVLYFMLTALRIAADN